MKSIFSILFTFLLIAQAVAQNGALSFSGYGPVAFDSFWRIPTVTSGYDQLTFSTFSRASFDGVSNEYFTQYFRADIPIGAGNGLSIRFPWHRFNVDPNRRLAQGMEAEGSEWGDLDFIFTINAFQDFFDRWADGKYNLLLIGEMHTAPTSRANRQFTDTIKMMGLIGFTGKWSLWRGTLVARTFVGVGGWQDDELPRQNHILKVSPSIEYLLSTSSNWAWGASTGLTALRGEKRGDDGVQWQANLLAKDARSRTYRLGLGTITYTEGSRGFVTQFEVGASFPIWFKGFQQVEAFRGS